ncbi:hypothetical protein FH972_004925 [Carpinus fangiana]|uniref:F-box associated domain-containing protein n=1 Tax=Carpinus fangiana TaxID=176857 RepID=A0A5N6QR04_9ROSI|nr:hypothetical protein FH972_004925 [Carpinus fangiana]
MRGCESCDHRIRLSCEVEVFSPSKRYWRRVNGPMVWAPEVMSTIRVNDPMLLVHETVLPTYVNGVVHWLCIGALLLFDVSEEVFRQIKISDGMKGRVRGIAACKGSLLACDNIDGRCGVWVMKEYGVTESWMKHTVIRDSDSGIWGPVSLSSGGELLVSTKMGKLQLFCNRQLRETKKLGDLYLDKCIDHSLVLIEEEESQPL